MADIISSAMSSIGQNLAGVTTGQNPLFAPQAANILGFNIPGIPLISARDYFLTQMESWFSTVPLTTQWVVIINSFPTCLNTNTLQALERVDGAKKAFDIDRVKSILASSPMQKITGCLFAQGVEIPSEEYGVEYVNVENNRGFTPAPIANQRNAPGQLAIDFLETNSSFTDFIIRPWVIAGSHYGFVTRNPNDPVESAKNVKTIVTVLQYTRTFQNISMVPRKIWNFYNCAPVNVPNQSMTYDTEGFVGGRNYFQTRWTYSHYTIENNMYLPLVSIIQQIASGKLPVISTLQNGSLGSGINPLALL